MTGEGSPQVLEAAEEVVMARSPALAPHGFHLAAVDQTDRGLPVVVVVNLTHPLRPGDPSFHLHGTMTSDEVRLNLLRWLDSLHTSVEIEGAAAARPEVWPMLRGLREAAGFPPGPEAADAITSAGYVLYESGILTFAEATWLAGALAHDQQVAPPGPSV